MCKVEPSAARLFAGCRTDLNFTLRSLVVQSGQEEKAMLNNLMCFAVGAVAPLGLTCWLAFFH